ncbi:MAG: oxygen-dependent coproporphyrinogen oxidase [Bacteroidetes bacterium]|nr:MAG: oxygen-dependent coproporphyrinogen oxidase [Bacteroidota bacterium]
MFEKGDIVQYFQSLQDTICKGLEQADGLEKFQEDKWIREGGGGGRTRVIQNGNVIEKGGVNFSEVFGPAPELLSKEPATFFASGVSLVIHPKSPMVPIIHMNVRHLSLQTPNSPLRTSEWFGGGIDLTPIYVDEADAIYFHRTLKATCDRFHPSFYPEFKKWADDYFFIKHRNETRGIGGIFFDHIASPPTPLQKERGVIQDVGWGQLFEFVQAIGNVFLPIYTHLIRKNKGKIFGEKEKQWQLFRRGRYAEFNLIYDRGTKFGLETNGRAESILMSLPPQANWAYNFLPEKNSSEEKMLAMLKKGFEWVM